MPANKNAMTRYKILDDLLSDRYHCYSLDDLTEEVSNRLAEMYPDTNGVVRRTIEKDIYYLEVEGPFLVEIERYSRPCYNKEKRKDTIKQCLRYAKPDFSIFKKEMSDDEKYLLSEALSILGQFDGIPNLEGLDTLRKVLGMKSDERQVISFTKNPLENSTLIGELFTTISHKQVIELHYHKFDDPEKELTVKVHPYLLKEYNRRWYLFAAADSDDKLLNFALDRIDFIVPQPTIEYRGYNGEINEFFDDIIGVTYYDDSPLYTILFWVSKYSMNYVSTKPLHDSQITIKGEYLIKLREKYPMLDGGRFFQIRCKYNVELIHQLFYLGPDLLVLSPQKICDIITEKCKTMNESYSRIAKIS